MISSWDYYKCTSTLKTAHIVTWLCCSLHFSVFVKWLVVGNLAVLTTHNFCVFKTTFDLTALGTSFWSHHNKWPAMLCFTSFLHRQPVKYLLSTKRRTKQWLGHNKYKILATHLKPWITQVFKSEVWIPCEKKLSHGNESANTGLFCNIAINNQVLPLYPSVPLLNSSFILQSMKCTLL